MAKDIEVKVKANVDKSELEEFKKFLDDIDDVDVNVDVNVEDEELKETKDSLDDIDDVDVNVDIDVDYSDVDDAVDSLNKLTGSQEDNKNSTDGLMQSYMNFSAAIHDVINTLEALISQIWSYVDVAGTVEDTNNRIAQAYKSMGVEGLDTTKELMDAVADLSSELGVTKGSVKAVMDNFSMLGANEKNIKGLTTASSGLAFMLGTNVTGASEILAKSISKGMIPKSLEATKAFKNLHEYVKVLENDSEMTYKEFQEYYKNLSEEGRLSLIEQFGRTERGKELAEEYANSWQATKEKLDAISAKMEQGIGKVFKPLIDAIIPAIDTIIQFLDEFNKLTDDAGNYIIAFILIAGAVATLATGIAVATALFVGLGIGIGAILSPTTLVVLAIVALGLALMWLYQNSAAFREFIDGMYDAIVKFKTDLEEVFKPLTDSWNNLMKAIGGGDSGKGLEMLRAIGEAFMQYLLFPLRFIIGVVVPLITFILDLNTILVQLATGQITLKEAVSQAWNAIKKLIMSVLRNVANAVPTFISQIVSYFQQLPDKVMNAIFGLKNRFINFFKDLASQAWNAVTSTLSGGSSGDINEHIKSGFAITSTQIINQYGFLDMEGGMDAVEKLNKGINRRNDLRMV